MCRVRPFAYPHTVLLRLLLSLITTTCRIHMVHRAVFLQCAFACVTSNRRKPVPVWSLWQVFQYEIAPSVKKRTVCVHRWSDVPTDQWLLAYLYWNTCHRHRTGEVSFPCIHWYDVRLFLLVLVDNLFNTYICYS